MWEVVQNPKTEKYQIYSNVFEAFILEEEVDQQELKRIWLLEFGQAGEETLTNILLATNDNSYLRRRYYEDSKMWDDHSVSHYRGSLAPRGADNHIKTCRICRYFDRADDFEDVSTFCQKGDGT